MIFTTSTITHDYKNNSLEINQKLRRATINSLSVTELVKKILENVDKSFLENHAQDFGIVYLSYHGELSSTQNYLKSYSHEGLCRPFVFQNSLHHSTPGFVSNYFNFQGPIYTFPQPLKDEQLILDLAHSLINADHNKTFLIIIADIPTEDDPIKSIQINGDFICKGFLISSDLELKNNLKDQEGLHSYNGDFF